MQTNRNETKEGSEVVSRRKKKDKVKKQLNWSTHCWECYTKIKLRDDDDPDKKIALHRASPECKARNR